MDEHIENPNHIQLLSWLKLVFAIALILAGISVFLTYKYINQTPDTESIQIYDLNMNVQKSRAVLVTETIVYDFGHNRKKGISRYIPLTSMSSPRLNISVLGVVNELGVPYKYEAPVVDDVLAIKIGDPDNFIKGIHTYKISYKVENGVKANDDFSEIYWNVTGDQWPAEIKNATASIILPSGAVVVKMNCSTGPRGSTEKNCVHSSSEKDEITKVLYSTTRPLMVIEGFTILLDFSLDI